MRNLPLIRWMAPAAAVTLLALAGCFGSHTTRDADFVQVWPPEDDLSAEAAVANGRRAAAKEAHAGGQSPYGEEVVFDAAAPAVGGLPPAASVAGAAADPRLTPEQQELLSAQFSSLSAAPPDNPAAAVAAGESGPPGDKSLQNYHPTRRVASPPSPATPATPSSSAPPPAPAATPAVTPASASSSAAPPAAAASDQAASDQAASDQAASEKAADAKPGEPSGAASTTAAPAAEDASAAAPETAAAQAASSTGSTSGAAAPEAATATTTAQDASSSAETAASSPEAAGAPPADAWRQHLDDSIAALEQQLTAADLEADQRLRLESNLRLMYVAAGRREEAVRPIKDAETHQQEFWKKYVYAMLELLAPDGPPVASRRAKLALRPLREALHHLAAVSTLDVRNLAICQKVESFGRYTEFTPYEFRPEQEVILYVEVSNFASESKDGGYETEFHGSYQILDAAGRRIVDYDLMRDQQVCRNVRTDYFLPYRIYMPKTLAPGTYQLQVTIEDKKGQKFGQTPPVEFKITS